MSEEMNKIDELQPKDKKTPNVLMIVFSVIVILYQLVGVVLTLFFPESSIISMPYIHLTALMNMSDGITLFGIIYALFAVVITLLPIAGVLLYKKTKSILTMVCLPYASSVVTIIISLFSNFDNYLVLLWFCFDFLFAIVSAGISFFAVREFSEKWNNRCRRTLIIVVIVLVLIIAMTLLSLVIQNNRYEDLSTKSSFVDILGVDDGTIKAHLENINPNVTDYDYLGRNVDCKRINTQVLAQFDEGYLYCVTYSFNTDLDSTDEVSYIKRCDNNFDNDEQIYLCERNGFHFLSYEDFFSNYNSWYYGGCCFYKECFYFYNNDWDSYESPYVMKYDFHSNELSKEYLTDINVSRKSGTDCCSAGTGISIKIAGNEYEFSCSKIKQDLGSSLTMIYLNRVFDYEKTWESNPNETTLLFYKLFGNDSRFEFFYLDDYYLLLSTSSSHYKIIAKVNVEDNKLEYVATIKDPTCIFYCFQQTKD